MTEQKVLLHIERSGDEVLTKVDATVEEMTHVIYTLLKNTEWFKQCLSLAELAILTEETDVKDEIGMDINNIKPMGDA